MDIELCYIAVMSNWIDEYLDPKKEETESITVKISKPIKEKLEEIKFTKKSTQARIIEAGILLIYKECGLDKN